MKSITKRQLIMVTVGGFLSYLLFGLFDSLKGPTLSALLEDTGFSNSVGGTIIMGQYAGYFAATLLSGILSDYVGKRVTLILAGISMCLGIVGYSSSSSLGFLIFFLFFIGMGLGSLELSGCGLITDVYPDKKGKYLNILTALAGFGAIVSPAVAGYLLSIGVSWRLIYRYGLMIVIPSIIYFLLMRHPMDNTLRTKKETPAENSTGSLSLKKDLLPLYLVNFSYMAVEVGIATWLVDFYKQEKGFSIGLSSSLLSLFFIGITLGRVFGSFFVDRIGHVRSILVAILCASICVVAGIFAPGSLSVLLALAGIFFSIIFPTSTAIISGIKADNKGKIMGVYFACGGLGGMCGPWLLGIGNDLLGLQGGMLLSLVFCMGIGIPMLLNRREACSQ